MINVHHVRFFILTISSSSSLASRSLSAKAKLTSVVVHLYMTSYIAGNSYI